MGQVFQALVGAKRYVCCILQVSDRNNCNKSVFARSTYLNICKVSHLFLSLFWEVEMELTLNVGQKLQMSVWETWLHNESQLLKNTPNIRLFPPSEHSTRLGIDVCLSESNFPRPSLVSQPFSAFCSHLIAQFSSFKLSDGRKIALCYTLNRNSLVPPHPPGMNRRRTWDKSPPAAQIRGLWQYLLGRGRINIQLKCRQVVRRSHLQWRMCRANCLISSRLCPIIPSLWAAVPLSKTPATGWRL